MGNRFLEMDQLLRANGHATKTSESLSRISSSKSNSWATSFSAQDRVLVILIENGGVDLGIPAMVEKIFDALHIGAVVPDSVKQQCIGFLKEKIKSLTDSLIETAELTLNRYNSAAPDLFSSVVVLRDNTSTYVDLKNTLIRLTKENKIMDLLILTHGNKDLIAVKGSVSGQKIRDIKTELGQPLSIRSVYMMNCVGSSLNQAWIDVGAKVAAGSILNNYLPEPTTYFFWKNWKEGQGFETAVIGAYRKTINLMNDAVKTVLEKLPLLSSYAASFSFENYDFVKDSAPVIQGLRSITINTDNLSFSQSTTSSSLATTVLPVSVLESMQSAGTARSLSAGRTQSWSMSDQCVALIKEFEGFRAKKYNDAAGHCTIGYGTLLHKGNCNGDASERQYEQGISEEQATQLLREKANGFQRAINDSVTVELNQNQYDALVSFVYNIGSGAFRDSTLLKLLNQSKYEAVPGEMKKWVKGRVDGQLVDLPGLVARRNKEAALFQRPVQASLSMSNSMPSLSRPFYDTGEHALLGEFINATVSGPLASVHVLQPGTSFNVNGVPFTYGQIITMGDFYNNYDQLIKAPKDELTRLKALVVRSENHYKNSILGIGKPAKEVTNEEWGGSGGIGHRFIELALANNSHFAPPPAGTSTTTANNKQSWTLYHTKAIQTARAGTSSDDLDQAYIINAFGDHFLTDAFSAGHLVNKEMVMNRFLSNVLSNGKVSSAGEKMLERIADGALAVSSINKMLGKFEVNTEHWYDVAWDLNDTGALYPEVFYRILVKILEDTAHSGSQKIANLAVKAVHDFLNDYKGGVPVVNSKGDRWGLAGDGTLNKENIMKIQLAIKQSVENIEDSVRDPHKSVASYVQMVWDYVPKLDDPATAKLIQDTITTYTTPSSEPLIKKAVSLIEDELPTLLNELLDGKRIRCKKNYNAKSLKECERS